MNVQRELDILAKKEQALRNKLAKRFNHYYDGLKECVMSNLMIIQRAEASNERLNKQIDEVIEGLQTLGEE